MTTPKSTLYKSFSARYGATVPVVTPTGTLWARPDQIAVNRVYRRRTYRAKSCGFLREIELIEMPIGTGWRWRDPGTAMDKWQGPFTTVIGMGATGSFDLVSDERV